MEDRVKGKVKHGTKPGASTVLSATEEESLVNYSVYMAERGFPLTRTMVKAFAWAIAKCSSKDHRFHPEYGPGNHWWASFKQRHPKLALRRTDSLEQYRAEYLNLNIVREYFDLLDKSLTDNNRLRCPRQLSSL